jgi:hypothetical protein
LPPAAPGGVSVIAAFCAKALDADSKAPAATAASKIDFMCFLQRPRCLDGDPLCTVRA